MNWHSGSRRRRAREICCRGEAFAVHWRTCGRIPSPVFSRHTAARTKLTARFIHSRFHIGLASSKHLAILRNVCWNCPESPTETPFFSRSRNALCVIGIDTPTTWSRWRYDHHRPPRRRPARLSGPPDHRPVNLVARQRDIFRGPRFHVSRMRPRGELSCLLLKPAMSN
jgi:hypothetical protein